MLKKTIKFNLFRSGAFLALVLSLAVAIPEPARALDPAAGTVLFREDFESYKPGIVEPGGKAAINDHWFSFRTDHRNSNKFMPEVRLIDGAGVGGSRGLRLFVGLRKLTTSSFFLGVRHTFTVDLGGVDLERLRFTAQARAEVTDVRTGRTLILPEEFIFAWRLESVKRTRGRGVRQFNATAMGAFGTIGGPLSEALSGRKLDYSELYIAESLSEYQVVLVLSSCCIGPAYSHGSYDIEIFLDDIVLELMPPDVVVRVHAPDGARFHLDGCRSGWPGVRSLYGARPIQ